MGNFANNLKVRKMNNKIATDAELQEFLDEECAKSAAEDAERKRANRAAKPLGFEAQKFNFKWSLYARAIGVQA